MGNHSLRLSEVLSLKVQMKKFPTQSDIGYYLAVFELISFICTFNENRESYFRLLHKPYGEEWPYLVKKVRLHASFIHYNSTLLKLLLKTTILVVQMLSN